MNKNIHGLSATRALNITVKQINSFIAAAEQKSFSRAAQQMYQSQPAFSRNIQELESALGEVVFKRSPQGVELSEFGATFLQHAHQLKASYANAQSGIANWRADQQNKLSLVGCASVMHGVLPLLLKQLRCEFTDCTLLFDAMSSAQVVENVLARQAALGVCTLMHAEPDLTCIEVLKAPLGLLVSKDYVLPLEIKSLADLKHLPLIRFHDNSIVSQTLLLHGIACDSYFNSSVTSCGVPGVFSLVGFGNMAMIATGFGASHPQASNLRFVPLPELLPWVHVGIISRRESVFNDRQHLMKELVRDSILAYPWHPSVRVTSAVAGIAVPRV